MSEQHRGVVDIIVGLFIAGILLPDALIYLSNSSAYVGVNPAVVVVATVLLPVLGIVAIAYVYLKHR
jgi:hypothetical protein